MANATATRLGPGAPRAFVEFRGTFRVTAVRTTSATSLLVRGRHLPSRGLSKQPMLKTTNVSYGGTAGIVTSMSLIIGLDSASASTAAIVSGLLIVALADNLTDALSIHIYQESEHLAPREAFRSTVTNFAARLLVSLTFVLFVLLLPMASAILAVVAWGLCLIVALTTIIARERKANVAVEIAKHVSVALVVILASKAIGSWIMGHLH